MSRGVSDKITYKTYNRGGQRLTAFWKPGFMTISTFRSEKLKDPTEEIFISTVKLLNRKNIVGTLQIYKL